MKENIGVGLQNKKQYYAVQCINSEYIYVQN